MYLFSYLLVSCFVFIITFYLFCISSFLFYLFICTIHIMHHLPYLQYLLPIVCLPLWYIFLCRRPMCSVFLFMPSKTLCISSAYLEISLLDLIIFLRHNFFSLLYVYFYLWCIVCNSSYTVCISSFTESLSKSSVYIFIFSIFLFFIYFVFLCFFSVFLLIFIISFDVFGIFSCFYVCR